MKKGTHVDIFRSKTSVCVCVDVVWTREKKRKKGLGTSSVELGCWWCSGVYKLTEDYIEQLLVVSPLAFHCTVVLHLFPIKYGV